MKIAETVRATHANTMHCPNAVLMLAQRLRRLASIKTGSGVRLNSDVGC